MRTMNKRQMLIDIRNYLSNPDHWCQFRQCRETGSDPSYCLMGAAWAWKNEILGVPNVFSESYPSVEEDEVYNALASHLPGVAGFNNTTTHEKLIEALNSAIEQIPKSRLPDWLHKIVQIKSGDKLIES